jgi:prophage regulatory protein
MTQFVPRARLLRLKEILRPHGPIPMSRSAFYAAVKSGRVARPVVLGPRTVAWREADIQNLIDHGVESPKGR